MTLREKQSLFASLIPRLIEHAQELGFEVTLGEAYRSPEEAARLAKLGKGIKDSLHTLKLAIDINLFRDGKYLPNTSDHQPLGVWWEKQNTLCAWGGWFNDGNHYSLMHEGKK